MDIYKESINLAENLNKYGHQVISQEIFDAINYSSTGTEALMRIRFVLKDFLGRDVGSNFQLLERVKNVLNKINAMID
jgi:hypothetical protein